MNHIEEKNLGKASHTKSHIYVRLGFSKEECENTVTHLNSFLANYQVHYQKLRNYHWNVQGGDFFDIHEKLEAQYNEVAKAIDTIAERVKVFGAYPLSTFKTYLEVSEIKEPTKQLNATEMVQDIINDYEILLRHLFHLVKAVVESGDFATEDLAKSLIKRIEKHHWMFSAFINEKI